MNKDDMKRALQLAGLPTNSSVLEEKFTDKAEVIEEAFDLAPGAGDAMNMYANMCMFMVSQVHFWHWQTRSHEIHIAAGEFYDKLNDKVDGLMEIFQGIGGVIKVQNPARPFVDFTDKMAVVKTLEDFGNMSESVKASVMDNGNLTYLIDEITGLTGHILYFLKLD